MNPYADTSFVVSSYLVDANTLQARAWLVQNSVPLIFTELHALEIRNAFRLCVFRGLLSADKAAIAWQDVQSDLLADRLSKTKVNWRLALRIAARLSEKHSATVGTRSLDVLHVAAAKTLRVTEFISFDNRQRTLATAEGLVVLP